MRSNFDEKNFKNFLDNTLIPGLNELEKLRKKRIFHSFLTSFLFAAICIVIALHIKLDGKTLGPLVFIAILPYVLITEKYKLTIQKKVMNLFTSYFKDLQYNEDECIPDFKLIKSKLFEFNKNDALTYFCGTCNSHKTSVAITKLRLTDKETLKTQTTFRGLISCSLTDKFFPSLTLVVNNFQNDTFADLKRVEHKDLNVFSNDTEENRPELSDEFCKWFKSLSTVFKSEKYAVAFFDNTILCAIYDENITCFEYKSIYQKISYCTKMQTMYEALIKLLELNFQDFVFQPHSDGNEQNQ